MNRETIEQKIREFGTGSPEFKGRPLELRYKENGIIYETEQKYDDPLDVIINGTNLYVDNRHYLKFEVDDWGLVIRLYYDIHYIGAIVNSWDDIKEFQLGRC